MDAIESSGENSPSLLAEMQQLRQELHGMAETLAALAGNVRALNHPRLCPICLAQFEEYAPYNKRKRARCPGCGSAERHRISWLYLKNETRLFREPTRLLHFAPEPIFRERFEVYSTINYTPATFDPAKPTEGIDIQALPFEDASFDLIYCSHVLEHVPDDHKAAKEMFRVLRSGGLAVLMVPIHAATHTQEDAGIVDPTERERVFGQWDHLRYYGRDFPQRLRRSGFRVEVEHYSDRFAPEVQLRYGLRPEPLFACTKPSRM